MSLVIDLLLSYSGTQVLSLSLEGTITGLLPYMVQTFPFLLVLHCRKVAFRFSFLFEICLLILIKKFQTH